MSSRAPWLLAACLSACAWPPLEPIPYACYPDRTCDEGFVCRAGYCYPNGSSTLSLTIPGGTPVRIGVCTLAQVTLDPASLRDLATAVAADGLVRQRALVLQRLRRLGVDVIGAPWQAVGYRLIDRDLAAKQAEAVG